jgi:hypothetical protein
MLVKIAVLFHKPERMNQAAGVNCKHRKKSGWHSSFW